ncbi:MAG: hypothetical protein JWO83_1260 [Caulobacteraceae bacterium]|jgi:hypothetical protein|nr:hypothetical protein [Caulobacteraceae bacterium]
MSDDEKPMGWYIVGEDSNYYIVEIIKKFSGKESAPSAEYQDAFKLVKELFHSGTPVHAVRIDEDDVLQFSGHKLR